VPTLRAVVASAVMLSASSALCADAERPGQFQAPWWGPEAAVLSFGSFGLRHPPSDPFAALEVRAGSFFWYLHLMSGVLGAEDGSAYFYVGVALDFPAADILDFVLSFAPGLYHAGPNHNLGYPLIFHSAVEVAVTLAPRLRLGLAFSHMSNGKLASPNPGIETLSVTLTFLALPY